MRLKRLHLQGFKTFAPKTEVAFGEGLTAVVGPNGSGKSNIADGIRWVLGEQSLSNLRAKKTEDLVFAGSSKRAPLGMAEVSITIDNSDRLLPLDFAEVTLTRRAYRSGENEYYINKSRVRLREVLDIASTLGQAYTVVGQGLVDAALSLRPEERRELFEEAAAIRGYFVQREDAMRRLGRTEENIARLNDLTSELEPQVRRMERQAKQAQEYLKLEADLRELQLKWYAGRWFSATSELAAAEAAEAATALRVQRCREAASANAQDLAAARAQVWELVDMVSALHEQRAQVGSRHATRAQSQAVLAERVAAAASQRQALAREGADLQQALEKATAQLAEFETDASARQAEADALREGSRQVVNQLQEIGSQIAALEQRRHTTRTRIDSLNRTLADLENNLRDAARRKTAEENGIADHEASLVALRGKLDEESAILDGLKGTVSVAQRAVADADTALNEAQTALREVRATRTTLEGKRREASRLADNIASQLVGLAGEQQANLFGGVRAVVVAAQEGKLPGYVGTVAELLRVPPHLETAIEASVGGRLQDVVMRSWDDAERGIALLKGAGAGRATFLPLDTLRAASPLQPPRGPGIVGLARDLVDFDANVSVVADSVLGRLLIVEDLPSARRVLGRMQAGSSFTLATLGGEVVRPGGSVTGGSNARDDANRGKGRTILGRERRRRELAGAHENALTELRDADKALERAVHAVQESDSTVAACSVSLEKARKDEAAARIAYMEQQSGVARLQSDLSWRTGLLAESRQSLVLLQSSEESTTLKLAEMREKLTPLQAELEQIEGEIAQATETRNGIAGSAGVGETRLAVLEENLRNLARRRIEVRADADRLETRLREIQREEAGILSEQQDISQQREALVLEVTRLAEELAGIEAQVGPREREVRTREAEVSRIEAEQSVLQETLLQADTAYSRAAVEKQRCTGSLESLYIEVTEELGKQEAPAEYAPSGATHAILLPLPLRGAYKQLSEGSDGSAALVTDEYADLERRVYALKAKISRMGPVNPLAEEEHTALLERHDYLQKQLWDLQGAADRLRLIISELDRTMRDQFVATFAQVNEAFQHYFTTLFGGGTAKLELTNPQDVTASGVELMAQPPGKRMQPLAALSGGERALTSAAILFALLKVRPVPFCVLDEVDAALDESNVTRFRASLQELGDKTQFVVITHNRGTIEAADTLYGVSMAGDGTSHLLSLQTGKPQTRLPA